MDQNDITLLAAERLEAALERLATSLEARLAAPPAATRQEAGAAPQDMVPRAEVERLSARLDEALGRLRALLGDDAGSEI
ncbi:hypothetical protein [Sediminicoccus sp. KRV36]|uniref:hypothetical protein n=1 Tax=Sediminicoccus sp. KRV36 TaxID=3133721 RepID=UPI00200DF56A|nr:hypothetical protein [Sediminicoccus rosea]UPY35269.1 hypothetical protein LHU95_13625 [Sediminicoccus rosea]